MESVNGMKQVLGGQILSGATSRVSVLCFLGGQILGLCARIILNVWGSIYNP